MHSKTLVYLCPTYATFKNFIIILLFIFLNIYLKLILKPGRKSSEKTLSKKIN